MKMDKILMQQRIDAAREMAEHMNAGAAAFKHLARNGKADQQCENAAAEMIRLGQRGIETLQDWECEVIKECSRVLIYHSGSATLAAQ